MENLILRILLREEKTSAGRIAERLGLSVPTVTKTLDGLVEGGYALNLGKRHLKGGRMPVVYSPNPSAAYFLAVEAHKDFFRVGVMDLSGSLVFRGEKVPFDLEGPDAFADLCGMLDNCLAGCSYREKLKAGTISIPGRVNVHTGESFNYFREVGGNLEEALQQRLGVRMFIENDSRTMCFGEYVGSKLYDIRNLLYINLGWGLGMGMILDGRLYYGTNGFSGEFGHISMFDNEIFCRCGKKGCIETEASGIAVKRLLLAKHAAGAQSMLSAKLGNPDALTLEDFVQAVSDEDMTMIEIMEEVGAQLGKGIAAMINVLNPQMVILGGELSRTGDYLKMATASAVRKYSINIASRATEITLGSNPDDVTLLGCGYIARDRIFGARDELAITPVNISGLGPR